MPPLRIESAQYHRRGHGRPAWYTVTVVRGAEERRELEVVRGRYHRVRRALRERARGWAPVTPEEADLLRRLSRCSFTPGCADKAFARDNAQATRLTTRQREYLAKLAHRYRGQLAGQPPKGRRPRSRC